MHALFPSLLLLQGVHAGFSRIHSKKRKNQRRRADTLLKKNRYLNDSELKSYKTKLGGMQKCLEFFVRIFTRKYGDDLEEHASKSRGVKIAAMLRKEFANPDADVLVYCGWMNKASADSGQKAGGHAIYCRLVIPPVTIF